MMNRHPDAAWEKFGQSAPYFGVVSHDRFRDAGTEGPARTEFFRSGEEHVERYFRLVREAVDAGFAPRRALDLGCGVGRVVIPLARRIPEVVGVDVSRSMLEEARRNCAEAGVLKNVELLVSDDALSAVRGSFDFVHSYIVFQHIPPRRGEAILRSLVGRLHAGGVGAVHLTYAMRLPRWKRLVQSARKSVPLVHNVGNLLQRRPFSAPLMQMNRYDLNRVFRLLQDGGCHRVQVRFSDHGGYQGVELFFRKQDGPPG